MISSYSISGIEIAVIPIERATPSLTAAQQTDVDGLAIEKRRAERRAVYALINEFIEAGALLGHFDDGAPQLLHTDGTPIEGLAFSLSHSNRFAAIAFSVANSNIGIDIEEPTPRMRRVAPKFLTQQERNILMTDDELLAAWTVKEAAFKALRQPSLTLSDIPLNHPTLHIHTISTPDFTLTLCR